MGGARGVAAAGYKAHTPRCLLSTRTRRRWLPAPPPSRTPSLAEAEAALAAPEQVWVPGRAAGGHAGSAWLSAG